ncbi:MAG: dihydropteroate synthase [Spirochaetaceae bacterium]|jgi:dihydropteroate synthase|nr:dihydropteroate synthase [Spirochaetaceae bacterium]
MGIVNVTPDSFWEGSRFSADNVAVAAVRMAEDGADIIDIGGESTRPGSRYVSVDEEILRVIPAVKRIREKSGVPISVDTRKKAVMEAAWNAGADILNDVSALEDDAEMADFVFRRKIPVILMHKRGTPAVMQQNTAYNDVIAQVERYLWKRIEYALGCGIDREKIILDPGIGFGKGPAENAVLIRGCGALCGGEFPVLLALSRKTCIAEMIGGTEKCGEISRPGNRLAGTIAANILAVRWSAAREGMILRVHDVRETVEALKVLTYLGGIRGGT